MIVDAPPADHLLRSRTDGRSRRRADLLVERFASAFPAVVFDVLWETDTCNAQAFVRDGVRHVRLYGGLCRHRYVGLAGLAFALAHEAGHHLAGPPSPTYHPCLASQEAADAWAIETGLAVAFGPARARRYGVEGPRQIARVYGSLSSTDHP
jgi:hypothetical protein